MPGAGITMCNAVHLVLSTANVRVVVTCTQPHSTEKHKEGGMGGLP